MGIVCKILQEDEFCVVRTVEAFLKTKRSLDEMKSKSVEHLPSVKKVLTRNQSTDVATVMTYQGVDLHYHTQGLAFLKSNYQSWLEAVDSCLASRLKVQEEQLLILTQAVTFLATHGWERTSTPSFGHASLEAVCD